MPLMDGIEATLALRADPETRDVPIFAGCSHPILGKLKTAEEVHGATGLNGVILPEPRLPLEQRHAVDAIIDIVMASADGSPVTLCPIGPLTNIALAMLKEPALASRLDKIVLMGGAIGLGNSTASAEFNAFVVLKQKRLLLTRAALEALRAKK